MPLPGDPGLHLAYTPINDTAGDPGISLACTRQPAREIQVYAWFTCLQTKGWVYTRLILPRDPALPLVHTRYPLRETLEILVYTRFTQVTPSEYRGFPLAYKLRFTCFTCLQAQVYIVYAGLSLPR